MDATLNREAVSLSYRGFARFDTNVIAPLTF
jgi:hypothetical protein